MLKSNIFIQLCITAIGLIVFILVFIIVRQIDNNSIIFYQGIVVSILFIFIIYIINIYLKVKLVNLSLIPLFLSTILFLGLIPTIVDRSVSVTVLSTLAKAGNIGMTEDEVQNNFIKIYVDNNHAVKVRINEQLKIDNIRQVNDRFFITEKGEFIVSLFLLISDLFKVNKTFARGEIELP